MTQPEIDRCKEILARAVGPTSGRAITELRCREMINSCLCYGSDFYAKTKRWVYGAGYVEVSYADDYIKELGAEVVDKLYNEQCDDVAKATILHNVGTDSEGCSYNAIKWEEESVLK